MATTTVSFLTVEGGSANVSFGGEIGDSTRTVEIFAIPATGYEFVGWEINVEDSSTGGGGGGGGGGGVGDADFAI